MIMLIRHITPMLSLKIYKKDIKMAAILKNKMATSLNVLLAI